MSRLAIIKKEKCKPSVCGWSCKRVCPINMKGGDCIFEGINQKAQIDEVLCSGCGICPKHCPFNAITIINLPEILNKNPIHQYGENGFRIFDLPIIQEGKITGIMGRNGIGKSTVISALSQTIRANFGILNGLEDNSDEAYFKKLNELFKGSVLQTYFSKLQKGEIKVSYKPQQIVNIPKVYSGKVIDLLSKTTKSKEDIISTCKFLNIDMILERDIKVLSGGELQRVAIAGCILKENANFYVLDEITNYLDIYQRLNVSRHIKEKVSDKTALIVEHDLIILDFLVDYIHIMYGEPGAYGTLTGVKGAKIGINDYLKGFSKEENVRFRDKGISFEKESIFESKRVEILSKWDDSSLKLGEFELEIKSGEIKKGEILGIIGQNALGKSTFINNISQKGLSDNNILKISYKPQLIPRSEETVLSILSMYGNFSDNFYEVYVLDPLNISSLLEKNINDLSGGELQRFAIAKCLLDDSDIYLLDEPTAFLDVEDRLKISKMIKNFVSLKGKSAFIIDHDLVFMDYLSDRLIVFYGEPGIKGFSSQTFDMKSGMNFFLKDINITFRRDSENKRPRVNKEGSVKDAEQKRIGEYYYV